MTASEKERQNLEKTKLSKGRSHKDSFIIVGIGASAGGLEAFTRLLRALPADIRMAFVLVQHLDPDHESALTALLSRATSMRVHEVTDKMLVQSNHIYIIPPNSEMTLKGGKLRLLPRTQVRGAHRSIDFFFKSLALEQRDRAIGVVLSGTASDGTVGLEDIKAEGGITFAQDESAKYDSMPRSAIAAGCVDFILPPEKIAIELARIATHPCVAQVQPLVTSSEETVPQAVPSSNDGLAFPSSAEPGLIAGDEAAFRKILLMLYKQTRVDFSLYKPATIQRRVRRRMVLNRSETLGSYAALLKSNVSEIDTLYSDLLISVTSFFRNPEAFDALKRTVFPKLLQQQRRPGDPVRVWVLGCSTGQEAYSIAIAWTEFSEKLHRAPPLQVFATDLNEALLLKARHGLYTKQQLQDVSPERLRRFFAEEQGGYRVSKVLRQLCVFARQNFLTDPPFSRMGLISCRNLLIYIEPALQQKILPTFHYALKPEGLLLLGASESIGSLTNLFEPVDKKLKIFVRKSGLSPMPHRPAQLSQRGKQGIAHVTPAYSEPDVAEATAQREADRLILARLAPPSVLVNSTLQILQFRGPTGEFLHTPPGKPTADLLKMARKELMLPLRTAIKKAQKENKAVRAENVLVDQTTPHRRINLEVVPLKNLKERCYLVFFEEATKRTDGVSLPQRVHTISATAKTTEARRITELERELAETRDYLQSLQEQHEAANEELQATNEEVTSGNEELQSINEELETSKEELESTNEELTTVNEEMAHRNHELNRLNADLKNLHVSINTPILLLGRDLTITEFTGRAEKVFNLLTADIGRPLSGIKHNLKLPDLEKFISESIDTASVRECEVQDTDGNWFVLRVRPYVTLDNRIDGAVLMLLDINVLKEKEQQIETSRYFAQAIIDSVPPLLVLNSNLKVQAANVSFYEAFAVNPAETENCLIYELGNGQWNIAALREALEDILPKKKTLEDYEVTHRFESIGLRTLLLNARQLDHMQTIIISLVDITERKLAKDILARHAVELQRAVDERTNELSRALAEMEHFSYALVHDLRAPLRAMQSFAELLLEEQAGFPDQVSNTYAQRIKSAAARLDRLVTDSLSYSKALLEDLVLEPVSLAKLIPALIESYPDFQPASADIEISPNLPTVIGNEAALTQCFSNLLSNAVKFAKPGTKPKIRVSAGETAIPASPKGADQPSFDPPRSYSSQSQVSTPGRLQRSLVRIWVEDDGIGVPSDSTQRIFGLFQQAAKVREGTGIGLAIVRKVVHQMGGQVGVESEQGKGSRFWVELHAA